MYWLNATQLSVQTDSWDNIGLPKNVDISLLTQLIKGLTLEALQKEPSVWPHFGLVSPSNTGSHADMNYATLKTSAAAITPYLARCFTLGYQHESNAIHTTVEFFPTLRELGVQAEQAMLMATQQVNTHKGAIFLLSVLLGALGQVIAKQPNTRPSIRTWLNQASDLAKPFIAEDFQQIPNDLSQTYGEWAYLRHGVTGVRGVVQNDYSLIQHAFNYLSRQPITLRRIAYSQMRLFFVAHSEDTNILKRGGLTQYQQIRKAASQALNAGGVNTQQGRVKVSALEKYMQHKQLSAAAAGDMIILLILTVRLYEKNVITR